MDNEAELMMGKDWVMTVTVANYLLKKYPELVQLLANQIQLSLLDFNGKVKALEKKEVGAVVSKPNPLDRSELTEEERNITLAALERKEKERREGGGRSSL